MLELFILVMKADRLIVRNGVHRDRHGAHSEIVEARRVKGSTGKNKRNVVKMGEGLKEIGECTVKNEVGMVTKTNGEAISEINGVVRN